MPLTSFASLPDSARLWVFNTDRALDTSAEDAFRTRLESFLGQWAAHGSALTVGYEIRYGRFIILGVDDSLVGPSGCSIDALTRFLRQISSEMGVEIMDAPEVCYRTVDGIVECLTRSAFAKLAEAGEVDADTVVFDATVNTVGAFRAHTWEISARNSWHARAFDMQRSGIENN